MSINKKIHVKRLNQAKSKYRKYETITQVKRKNEKSRTFNA